MNVKGEQQQPEGEAVVLFIVYQVFSYLLRNEHLSEGRFCAEKWRENFVVLTRGLRGNVKYVF